MVKGSCMCGEVTFEVTGDPLINTICHCEPCHKNAGANGTTNTFVKDDQLQILTGSLRTWSRVGISGHTVTYRFCTTCPTIVAVHPAAMGDVLVLKPGTFNVVDGSGDGHPWETYRPTQEIFVKDRVPWCERFGAAVQKEVM